MGFTHLFCSVKKTKAQSTQHTAIKTILVTLITITFLSGCTGGGGDAENNKNSSAPNNTTTGSQKTQCEPSAVVEIVSCKSDILNSVLATRKIICNASGTATEVNDCILEGCETGFRKDGNLCIANACTPLSNQGSATCKDDILHSTTAVKTRQCNEDGTGYIYGTCNLEGCESGYYISQNACVAQACTPSRNHGLVSCVGDIAHSIQAVKTKTCDLQGSSFNYGVCTLTSCETGYYISGNSCIAVPCAPNSIQTPIGCLLEAPHSAIATKTKTCDSLGSGYTYGTCVISTCEADYILQKQILQNQSCIARPCTPNQSYPVYSCTNEIPLSLIANKSKTCNSSGNGYLYGSCTLQACQTGSTIVGNTCRSNGNVGNPCFVNSDCNSVSNLFCASGVCANSFSIAGPNSITLGLVGGAQYMGHILWTTSSFATNGYYVAIGTTNTCSTTYWSTNVASGTNSVGIPLLNNLPGTVYICVKAKNSSNQFLSAANNGKPVTTQSP